MGFASSLMRLAGVCALALSTAACGEIEVLKMDLTFPDQDTELRTRALQVIVREVPTDGSEGCTALWSDQPTNLNQTAAVVAYPNRNDALAANVDIRQYPALSLLVYSYPQVTIETPEGRTEEVLVVSGEPLAGGCQTIAIPSEPATTEIKIDLSLPQ